MRIKVGFEILRRFAVAALIGTLGMTASPRPLKAACSPSSARICANADDLISIWLNGTNVGSFSYVGSYDLTAITCQTLSGSLFVAGANTLAI